MQESSANGWSSAVPVVVLIDTAAKPWRNAFIRERALSCGLRRRRLASSCWVAALEASLSPAGKVVAFWAITGDGHPMTDRETEREIEALRAKGAPANARIVPITWLPSIDPL